MPGKEATAYGLISNYSGNNTTLYGQQSFAYGDNSLAVGNKHLGGR